MDFLPTKGIEYLLALSYLFLLVPFWWFFVRKQGETPEPVAAPAVARRGRGWFHVPQGFHFHRGHTWARPDENGLLRVGMDDFARLFIGPANAIALPAIGDRLDQGRRGWTVQVDGHDVPMLSPLRGEVAEVNEDVLAHPDLVQSDPYGRGWLLKMRAPREAAGLNNLLPSGLAQLWMDDTTRRLGGLMSPELGTVLQDGGELVSGIARELAGDEWPALAAEMLLTKED